MRSEKLYLQDIAAFRNIAVHAYFSIDWFIVWKATTKDAPELGCQAAEILKKEFPEGPKNSDRN